MAKRVCPKCRQVVDMKHQCEKKNGSQIFKDNTTDLRESNQWRKLRGIVLEKCRYIDLVEYALFGRVVVAEQVHHIKPYRQFPDLVFEEWNVIALSTHTHKIVEGKKEFVDYLLDLKKRFEEGKVYRNCDKENVLSNYFR